jgi:FkbM family methyltransferase
MRQLVRSSLERLGLDVRRVHAPESPFIPYIEHYSLRYAGAEAPCEFDFWIANKSTQQWYKEWLYAMPNPTWELDEMSWLVKPGDRVLDIGCHHGFLSMMLAHRIGPSGSLFALDANPENAMIAGSQFALNKLPNCSAHHLACGDKTETLTMEWRTNSHVVTQPSDAPSYEVACVTADELDSRHGPFNVIKIDVEGYEVAVLRGCQNILRRRPKLILEVHPNFMPRYGVGVDDIWPLIGYRHRGTTITAPDFHIKQPFNEAHVSESAVSYLFLEPRVGS